LVAVTPAGIGLPELDQRVRHGPAVLVEHTPIDDDARTDSALAWLGIVDGQIVIELAKHGVSEDRPRRLRQCVGKRDRRALRRAHHAAAISRREGRRMPAAVPLEKSPHLRKRVFHFSSPDLFSDAPSMSASVCLMILIAWLAAGTPP